MDHTDIISVGECLCGFHLKKLTLKKSILLKR